MRIIIEAAHMVSQFSLWVPVTRSLIYRTYEILIYKKLIVHK